MGELQYPESKEFLSGLKSLSKIKTIIKHVVISAVSLISMIGFILALWQMHVFVFVWSGLKHYRQSEDECGCMVRYQPEAAKEIQLSWNETTRTATSHMTYSDTIPQSSTNTSMKTAENMKEGSVKNLRASKLIELCQAKLESLEENIN